MTITFSKKFNRYEVYSVDGVVRNRELQPVFVCGTRAEAIEYIRRVKGAKE